MNCQGEYEQMGLSASQLIRDIARSKSSHSCFEKGTVLRDPTLILSKAA